MRCARSRLAPRTLRTADGAPPPARPFAHRLDRGRLRRLHVRGKANVHKQQLLLAAAQNLGLLLRAKC